MERRRALVVDAFTDEPLRGAPAGVVPDAAGVGDDRLRAIAAELAPEVTAFVFRDDGGPRLRCFSARGERDARGRATLAACAHLYDDDALDTGTHAVGTAAGTQTVRVDDDGTVWLERSLPAVRTVELDFDRVGTALGIVPDALKDVGADLPAGIATGAASTLVLPVNFLERLGEADPDPVALDRLAEEHDVDGVYAVTFDALDVESTLHGRYFVPEREEPERPASVGASLACGAYLRTVDAFDDPPDEFRFEGGHFVDRSSVVRVRPDGAMAGGESGTALVGGRTATALDGEVRVPAGDDDEIIEA